MPATLLAILTVLVGTLLAVQPLINARAGGAAGHPVYGALVSVTVSTLALTLAALALRFPAPDLRGLASAPALTWTGGLIGALVVLTALTATPRQGAGATVALFIAGQLGASLLLGFGLDDDRVHSPNEKFELVCYERGIRTHVALLAELAATTRAG